MSKQGRTNRHIEFFLGTLIFVPIMLALVVVSYYEVNYFGLLIFKGLDGHCELGYQSLGNHCFGDYWAIDFTGFMSPLKPAEGVYLPFARIATAPVKIIIMIFGNQTGIVLSAVLAMVLVIAGVLNRRLTQLDPIEILFISSSIPVLAIYDRLNTVWLAFLFLTFAFKAQTARRSITFLSLAILIKPGLIVFAYPILIELFEKTEPKRSIKY